MKRTLFAVATVAIALLAVKAYAAEAAAAKTTNKPDWHYRWHEGRWWYWLPENKWVVWDGSSWVPCGKLPISPIANNPQQAKPYSVSYGSFESQDAPRISPPTNSVRNSCPPAYSARSTVDYAGYGWTWGPGTAFRDGPGRRF